MVTSSVGIQKSKYISLLIFKVYIFTKGIYFTAFVVFTSVQTFHPQMFEGVPKIIASIVSTILVVIVVRG